MDIHYPWREIIDSYATEAPLQAHMGTIILLPPINQDKPDQKLIISCRRDLEGMGLWGRSNLSGVILYLEGDNLCMVIP